MSKRIQVLVTGSHFVLASAGDEYGIWDRTAAGRRRPGSPIARFPLTDAGREAAWEQFSGWEPDASPPWIPPPGSATGWEPTAETPAVSGEPASRGRRRRWAVPVAATAVLAVVLTLILVGFANSPDNANLSATSGGSSSGGGGVTAGSAATSAGSAASPASSVPAAVGSGYLASGSGFIDFIQWTDHAGDLSGTAQTIGVQGSPPDTSTQSQTIPLTGSLNGSTLSVSFDGNPQTFGTISDGSFTLNFPQSDGSLGAVTFSAASASAFNQDLALLQAEISTANQNEANAEALQKQEQQIDSDAQSALNDIGALSQDESSLSSAVGQTNQALQTTGAELATTKKDDQAVQAEAQQYPDGNSGGVCADAGGVGADAGGVEADAGGVEANAGGVENYLQQTRQQVSQLASDWAQFENAENNLPSYQPPNPPTQKQVNAATATANSAASQAVSATNSDISQANSMVATAYGYAAQAYQAGNCGTPPSAPQPQGKIS